MKKLTEAEKTERFMRDRAAIRGISYEEYKRQVEEFNKTKNKS